MHRARIAAALAADDALDQRPRQPGLLACDVAIVETLSWLAERA